MIAVDKAYNKRCLMKNIPSFYSMAVAVSVVLSMIAAQTADAQSARDLHRARSVSAPEADNSVSAQLKSFRVADGYAINLFADETNGVANPVCMNWDAAGRLWVLCTWAYPQLKPVDKPNDKLLILTDTDGDGRADKTTVFADGLNMPTGFALGDGGAYIAHGTDLLLVKDTDGDGKADASRVVFTGFGTGDTHQNVNSLTWSPGGELFFCQGLHAFARVETPWGIVRLNEHGVWRMRPRRLQLHSFRGGSGQNPWGVAFGEWGEPFVKGNNQQLSELLPVMVYTDHFQRPLDIGATKIKSMIVEIVDSPHLPDDIQGDILIAGYFAHVVDRLEVTTDGSGHRCTLQSPLLSSSHRAFRPVDIKVGPDGAIFVADWFNPIIGHYQASFRHPDRDKKHGRIWRITAKDRPLAKAPALASMSLSELCQQLESDWQWVRVQAKRRLMDGRKRDVIAALKLWLSKLDKRDPNLEHHLYEAIGVFESHEVVDEKLLLRLLNAKDARARAYATRVVGRWHDRLKNPLALLNKSVEDASPRVRLEAIVACSEIPKAQAMVVAAKASSRTRDRFINAALSQSVHALAGHWLPALRAGEVRFEQPGHLVHVLSTYGGKNVAGQVRGLLADQSLPPDGRRQLLELLARVGTASDLQNVFNSARNDPALLESLVHIARVRRMKPSNVNDGLTSLINSEDSRSRAAAVRLAGLWQQKQLTSHVEATMNDGDQADTVRAAAVLSFGELSPKSTATLRGFITDRQAPPIRLASLEALSRVDLNTAMIDGLKLIEKTDEVAAVLEVLMRRRGAPKAMVAAMSKTKVTILDAGAISGWLNSAGISDPALNSALQKAMRIKPTKPVVYSDELVKKLVASVKASGNPVAGKKVFESSVTGCVACHRVGDVKPAGFEKGPELTAVGAGLQIELIVESIIWPKRQIKEGYEATTLTLDLGDTISGYVIGDSNGVTRIRDVASGKVVEVANNSIEQRAKMGTLMPEGLTAYLSDEELRDLVAYLASLKGQ